MRVISLNAAEWQQTSIQPQSCFLGRIIERGLRFGLNKTIDQPLPFTKQFLRQKFIHVPKRSLRNQITSSNRTERRHTCQFCAVLAGHQHELLAQKLSAPTATWFEFSRLQLANAYQEKSFVRYSTTTQMSSRLLWTGFSGNEERLGQEKVQNLSTSNRACYYRQRRPQWIIWCLWVLICRCITKLVLFPSKLSYWRYLKSTKQSMTGLLQSPVCVELHNYTTPKYKYWSICNS